MKPKKLNKIDLNLLHVFTEIYSTRSITQASYNLGITQPAVSNALARLRKIIGDTLFLRSSHGMMPTPLAIEIAPVIRQAITSLDSIIDGSFNFNPAQCKKVFCLAMTDYGAATILPEITKAVDELAPNVGLRVIRLDKNSISEKLLNGDVDLAFSSSLDVASDIYAKELFSDEFTCMVRIDHESINETMSEGDFVNHPHVLYTPQEGKWGVVADLLSAQGIEHRTKVYTTHAYAIPQIIANTNLITVIPKRLAQTFLQFGRFRLLTPPFDMPTLSVRQFWHLRTNNSQPDIWLRNLITNQLYPKLNG